MTRDDLLTFNGVTQSISEWALDYGITVEIIMQRLRAGMRVGKAITKPMLVKKGFRLPDPSEEEDRRPTRPNAIMATFNGETRSLLEWSRITGISRTTIGRRLDEGWTIEKALTTPPRGKAKPGVVSNLRASLGTGAGSDASEISEIDSHTEKASQ
ncbi:hypothetical protein PZ895_10300 [Mesorhizobium sp. YIM 152430]|uniref:hypothetical protein n=1 Tax=Mesorhizobium sp. YIM 152430 TaxID=3031761 RepID=UPI0023DCE19A|nr:hypothetical protein [Mesorhizobium sp. YIM 152430]MDF1600167.1 hypothetical protein [Mesorhizobium sp. YIM 152430]